MSDLLLIGGFWQCYCVEIEKKKKKNLRNREDEFHEQKMNVKRRKSKQTTIYPGVWGQHCDCACVGRGCLSARAELWGIVSQNLKQNQQVAQSNWCNVLLKKLLKRKQHTYSLPDSLQPPPKSNDKLGCFSEAAWRHVYPVVKLSITTLSTI